MVLCPCIKKEPKILGHTKVFIPLSVELGDHEYFILPLDWMLVHYGVTPLPSLEDHSTVTLPRTQTWTI